jgi:hypothetical protein
MMSLSDGTSGVQTPTISLGQVTDWLRLFVRPGDVTELRAIKVQQRYGHPQTIAGFFDYEHLGVMAAEALRLDKHAKAIYFVLNQVSAAMLARICNRVRMVGEGETTNDSNIIARRWLPIDADPVRPKDISSTDIEKTAALEVVQRIRCHLTGEGWPLPILADSGNGYHLLYRIDLPANDSSIVERILKSLAARFNTDSVAIDQKVFNPARIWKLYGTTSCKGDSTLDRPHRRSCILEVP